MCEIQWDQCGFRQKHWVRKDEVGSFRVTLRKSKVELPIRDILGLYLHISNVGVSTDDIERFTVA